MRILDLYCGAGGASVGYGRAFPGADIVGVDIYDQPDYPFTFVKGNVLEAVVGLDDFDFIHASPPCQAYSAATPTTAKDTHPDLVGVTREMLTGHSFVIENVMSAPVRRDLMLCGSMFGLQVQRHRKFEFSENFLPVTQPLCDHTKWVLGNPHTVVGHADGSSFDRRPKYLGYRDLNHARELMDMPWVSSTHGIVEAIPPAYSEWIGRNVVAANNGR